MDECKPLVNLHRPTFGKRSSKLERSVTPPQLHPGHTAAACDTIL